LIYRLYGASLGDVGSADLFSGLFSQFALGSAAASTNPRAILDGLSGKSKKAGERTKKLITERRQVESQIREASRAPEEIEALRAEIAALNEQIETIGEEASSAAGRAAMFEKVRDGLQHLEVLRAAQAELNGHPVISAEWELLVDNEHGISDLVTRVTELQKSLDAAERAAGASAGACGMPQQMLEGRTLTPLERTELSRAVSDVVAARKAVTSTNDEVSDATAELNDAIERQSELTRALGLSNEQTAHLDHIAHDIPNLSARADRWVEAINNAIALDAQVEGEKAKILPPSVPPMVENRSTSVQPWLVVALLAVVGIVGAVQRIAGLVAAIAAVGAYLVLSRRQTPQTEATVPDRGSDQVVTNLVARAKEARESARLHRAELERSLGVLSAMIDQPDTANVRLAQLSALAQARVHTAECRKTAENARDRASLAGPVAAQAEKFALSLAAPRGISAEMLAEGFDEWLAKYETAVSDVAKAERLRLDLDETRDQLSAMVEPVKDEVGGLSPSDVAARVASMGSALRARRAAQSKVREAEIKVAAANMNSQEVNEILAVHRTTAELQVVIDACNSDTQRAKELRDDLIASRVTATTTLDAKLGTEILPGLHLELGRIQEEIEEAERENEALKFAVSVLSDVIEKHEREHQDPVVLSASNLVAQVVPEWGSILMSRTDKGALVIERTGADGRFKDSVISDGGRALLYMGIRLAFAQKDAERRGVSLPIICDDPFVHFDDARTESGVRLLASISSQNQVILLTCESEVRDLAVSLGASAVSL
jgi:DNA repair exonuclease SbcCD ATPase subunit